MTSKTIFVSVGTTRFDKLIKTVLLRESIELFKSLGYNRLNVQIGNDACEYKSCTIADVEIIIYRFKDSIMEDIKEADLVISHAGAGTCLEVLDQGKPLLVIINTDLMDNHQTEIAEQLYKDGHLYYCTCDTFHETLGNLDFYLLKPYEKADATPLFEYLDGFLGFT